VRASAYGFRLPGIEDFKRRADDAEAVGRLFFDAEQRHRVGGERNGEIEDAIAWIDEGVRPISTGKRGRCNFAEIFGIWGRRRAVMLAFSL